MKNQKGFALGELLIVFGLMAFITVMVVGCILSVKENQSQANECEIYSEDKIENIPVKCISYFN